MRSVLCDEDAFARLVGPGGLYDYELGERYVVAPAASSGHGTTQAAIIGVLLGHFGVVAGPTNLGVLGEPGARWYVVPDVVVLPDGARDLEAQLRAVIVVEVRSPREDASAKLAAYREVMARTGLEVGEVWYVDGATLSVHPRAAEDPGESSHPQALADVRALVGAEPSVE